MTNDDTSPAIVLPIEGMTCGACVSRVEAALRSVPGVTDVAVDPAAGRAIRRSSLEKAGYAAVAAESAPPVSPGAALASALFRAGQFGSRRSREAAAA